MQRIDALAEITQHPEHLTRVSFSDEHRRANQLVAEWMQAAGMQVHTDAVGNIIGRYEGLTDGPALLLGSHLDTVRNAGRYDGMLGVVTPITCIEALNAADERLPFPVEVIGFCDEEGVRFPATLLGSRALAGTLQTDELQLCDSDGISIAQALKDFDRHPDLLSSAERTSDSLLGFVELHIEQGPVLEQQ